MINVHSPLVYENQRLQERCAQLEDQLQRLSEEKARDQLLAPSSLSPVPQAPKVSKLMAPSDPASELQDDDLQTDDLQTDDVQAEATDTPEQHRDSIRRKAIKHIKWLANKRQLKNVVLHSFTHLGGETAEPGFAEPLIQSIADRLNQSGYHVQITPFGYFCEWDLSVHGESLAKVWKEIH